MPYPLAGPSGLAAEPLLVAESPANLVIAGTYQGGPFVPVAGNGTLSYFGDNGSPTQATFSDPPGVAVDSAGNIYIPDPGDHCVRMVSAATKEISTIAGIPGVAGYSDDGVLATSANLNTPTGVALDIDGNLYIADSGNGVVRRLDMKAGTISTVAGNGGACHAQQPMPGGSWWMGYCYAGEGDLATNASLGNPCGLAFDSAQNLYIADKGNNLVLEVNASTQQITTVAGNGTQCMDAAHGGPCYGGDGGAATSGALFSPASVAADAAGNLYIADAGNSRIRMVDPSHILSTYAGTGTAGYNGEGVAAASANLSNPQGLGLDHAGNLYIADRPSTYSEGTGRGRPSLHGGG